MALQFLYSIQNDTLNHKVDSDRLTTEIAASAITIALNYIATYGDTIEINFKDDISSEEKTILDTVVATHTGEPLPQSIVQDVSIKSSTITLQSQSKGFKDLTGHNYWKKGFKYNNVAGQITNSLDKFTSNVYLCGGGYRIDGNANEGDYAELRIIDVDNVVGYGNNVVLGTFVSSDYVWPNKEWQVLMEDGKFIPPGVYFQFRYNSTGSTDVKSYVWYDLRT